MLICLRYYGMDVVSLKSQSYSVNAHTACSFDYSTRGPVSVALIVKGIVLHKMATNSNSQ